MLAFDYYVNGKKLCTAGLDGAGVVAVHGELVHGVPGKKEKKSPEDLHLHVGGFFNRTCTHVTGLHRKLRKGDCVRIDVVEAKKVDRPEQDRPESVAWRRKREQD